jgi:hypothetical protein
MDPQLSLFEEHTDNVFGFPVTAPLSIQWLFEPTGWACQLQENSFSDVSDWAALARLLSSNAIWL